MIDLRKYQGSEWLEQDDIDGPKVVTIEEITEEELRDSDSNGKVEKLVLWFEGLSKGMVCNKTNTKTLIQICGDSDTECIGKEVELYVDPNVEFGGRRTGGLRIRAVSDKDGDEDDDQPRRRRRGRAERTA